MGVFQIITLVIELVRLGSLIRDEINKEDSGQEVYEEKARKRAEIRKMLKNRAKRKGIYCSGQKMNTAIEFELARQRRKASK